MQEQLELISITTKALFVFAIYDIQYISQFLSIQVECTLTSGEVISP